MWLGLGLSIVALIKSTDPLGPEEAINGTFDADTDWTKYGTSVISGGVYSASGVGTFTHFITQASSIIAGKTYRMSFEIKSNTSGGVIAPRLRGTVGASVSSVGVHTEDLVAGSSDTLQGIAARTADFIGDVDNISIKEVL